MHKVDLIDFLDIQPQTASKEAGPEPTLYRIIVHYYTSHGIDLVTSKQLATQYVYEWFDLVDMINGAE